MADILIITNVQSLARIMNGAQVLRDAIKTKQMLVQRGNDSNLKLLSKILGGIWDE